MSNFNANIYTSFTTQNTAFALNFLSILRYMLENQSVTPPQLSDNQVVTSISGANTLIINILQRKYFSLFSIGRRKNFLYNLNF